MIKFALLIAACACALASKPRCFCPIEYNPVCGTDGRTYLSECILTCALQRGKGNNLGKQGPCDPPPCTCPTDYNPVCGSNGVTYGNDCLLNCATVDDSTLSISRKGSCDHTVAIVDQPTCHCPDDFKPVCGADGVTYTSECLLKCAEQKLAKVGPCEPACACPNVKKQVCGSNGVTYDNTCWLNCATKDDSSLSIAGVGPCDHSLSEGVILIVEQPGCRACRSDSKPVCGKDRNTYSNECVLECAGVELLKEGACEPPCTCPAEKSPVCGTDNVTYGNVCLLNCATLDDSSLSVARSGACGSDDGGGVKVVEQPDCTCTRNFKPVCGTDGVTYNNECLLGCAGQTLAKVGSCESTCTCPKEGKAVCGTNGRTYANVCLLNCATKDDSTLGVNHPGLCKTHIDVRKS